MHGYTNRWSLTSLFPLFWDISILSHKFWIGLLKSLPHWIFKFLLLLRLVGAKGYRLFGLRFFKCMQVSIFLCVFSVCLIWCISCLPFSSWGPPLCWYGMAFDEVPRFSREDITCTCSYDTRLCGSVLSQYHSFITFECSPKISTSLYPLSVFY